MAGHRRPRKRTVVPESVTVPIASRFPGART